MPQQPAHSSVGEGYWRARQQGEGDKESDEVYSTVESIPTVSSAS